MRRVASAFLAAAGLVGAAAGCGGSSPSGQRTLETFLSRPQGKTWAKRFPHRPGSLPCTAVDPTLHQPVPATCSTALSPGPQGEVIATFTQSWSHGSQARTWFVFLRPDATVASIRRAGVAG